jgi:hypothetical protein
MATNDSAVDVAQFARNLRTLRYREVTMTLATLAVVTGAVFLYPGTENVGAGVRASVGVTTFALFLAVAVFGGVVKGTLGFGYALVTTPIFASVVDPTLAVVVLAVPPWMINVFQIGETDTGLAFVREEWVLMLLAAVGAVVGVVLLAEVRTGPAVPFAIAIVLLGYVAYQVLRGFVTVERAHHPAGLSVAGFLEGFLLAVSNLGPLLPAYFHTFERDADRYIGGLSMVLGLVFTVRIVQMALFTDLLTAYRLWLGCVIAVVTLVGLLAGTYLRRVEVDQTWFDRAVVALLFVVALNIFRKTVPALFL